MKGPLAMVVLVLILLPYAVFFTLEITIPSNEEASYTTTAAHYNCSETAHAPQTILVGSGASSAYHNISAAIAAAAPGDTILVKPGDYHEAVVVNKPCLTIKGTDRLTTILNGGNSLANGIEVSQAPGVTVANLTTKDYTYNGVYFAMSNDWAIKGVRSLNDGHYGMYAAASTYGTMADDFAMGNGDSGFYIGVTPNCSCEIVNSTAYGNVLGYSGTNANGVIIRDSKFINNSVGIGPNTLLPDWQAFLGGTWKLPLAASNHTIEGNLVANNDNFTVAGVGISQTYGVPIGTGILISGTSQSTVRNNTIVGNKVWGIAEFTFFNIPVGNSYSGNTFSRNGQDYFTDGTGFFGCSADVGSTGSTPPPCSTPSWLRVRIPNPFNELILILTVGTPGISGNATSVILVPPVLLLTAMAGQDGVAYISPRRKRIATSLMDLLVVGDLYLLLVSAIVVAGFHASSPTDVADLAISFSLLLSPLAYAMLVTVWFLYGALMETTRGATVGKWLLGLRTTLPDGRRAGLPRILLKNLLVYIDALFFGLFGLVSILLKHRTIGEFLSGTATTSESQAAGNR